ncbi:MAG: hypothetical protein HOY79_17925 [Streptomyces sp.]|nr:hypothetical protein [Streptomyces sp.]
MSAIHTGTIAVRILDNGLLEFTGTSPDRPITDWTLPGGEQTAQPRIPKQRAGSALKNVVFASKAVQP